MKTIVPHLLSLASPGRPRQRHAPFTRYILALVACVVIYGWLFGVLMAWEGQEHSWFTGIYWALTVMSTLGFGDITFTSDLGRAFSTLVLVSGVVLLLIILPFLFIRFVYAPWLDEQSHRKLTALRSLPADVSGHVVICADDPIARGLTERLQLAGMPAYVIEPDPVAARQMHDEGRPVITGDIDDTHTYLGARVAEARLLLANGSDTVNSNIILTVRELTSSVPVVAVAEFEDSVDVLELSGSTHVLPLKKRLGEHLAARVSAGSARANVIGSFEDLVLAEFPVHGTPFQGRTNPGDKASRGHRPDDRGDVGRRSPSILPGPDSVLDPASMAVAIGTPEQIQELDEVLVIYDANPNPVIVIGGGKVGRAAAKALKRRGVRREHRRARREPVKPDRGDSGQVVRGRRCRSRLARRGRRRGRAVDPAHDPRRRDERLPHGVLSPPQSGCANSHPGHPRPQRQGDLPGRAQTSS